jgi:FMN phosphatase YigB (HAD superfamily)
MQQLAGKYILCDVHGVLTDGQERARFLAQMDQQYGMNSEQHNALWNQHIDNLDKKTETAGAYLRIINKTFRTKLTVPAYFGHFVQEIKVNTELLQKLSTLPCPVIIASDNVPAISAQLGALLGASFRRYRKFYSWQLGMTKREGMLEKVINKLDINPRDCIFIDDSPANIPAAQALGITAWRFTTNEELWPLLERARHGNCNQ